MTELNIIIAILNKLDGINRLDAEINGWTIEINNRDWRSERSIEFTRPYPGKDETLDDIPIEIKED